MTFAMSTLIWGPGNIEEDPLFAVAGEHDYRLLWESPCMDAGLPDSLDPDGSRSDIGAHYFDQDDYITLYITPDLFTSTNPDEMLILQYPQ